MKKNLEIVKLENLEINVMKFFVNKNGKSFYNIEKRFYNKEIIKKDLDIIRIYFDNKIYNFRIYDKKSYFKLIISLKN